MHVLPTRLRDELGPSSPRASEGCPAPGLSCSALQGEEHPAGQSVRAPQPAGALPRKLRTGALAQSLQGSEGRSAENVQTKEKIISESGGGHNSYVNALSID